jgi:hypothetical protein
MDIHNYNLNYEQIFAQIPKLLPPNPSFGQYIGAAIVLLVILVIVVIIIWASIRYKQKKSEQPMDLVKASAPPEPSTQVSPNQSPSEPQVPLPTLSVQSDSTTFVTKKRPVSFVKSIEQV